MLSVPDMAIIGVLALILFGPEQLPSVAKRVGRIVRDVQNTSQSFIREMERAADDYEPPPKYEAPSTYEPPATYEAPTTYEAPATHEAPPTHEASEEHPNAEAHPEAQHLEEHPKAERLDV